MNLYQLARRAKGKYKEYVKAQAGRYLSPVRRIERVAPIPGARLCAMTFDDGPAASPTNPPRSDRGLTDDLLDTLARFGAKGTFDVIGSTEENYPDVQGPSGSFTWGGEAFDHYPDFGLDHLGGVKNQPALTRRILNEGHEITSHTYAHRLFGQNRLIYGKRRYFENIHEVIDDLKRLDTLLRDDFSYQIRLSRPPHYIDKTCDGHSSYDAYRYMNYQYMAASFDGGGWQVSGDYKKDVAAMVTPLERALTADIESLNGQIIFQKDGCNMSRETPVADALAPQLKLLYDRGYQVITVSDLLARSPFEDTGAADPVHESARALINRGYCVAYQNNSLQPDRVVTLGEFLMMCAEPEALLAAYRAYVDAEFRVDDGVAAQMKQYHIAPTHPYAFAVPCAIARGVLPAENSARLRLGMPLTAPLLSELLTKLGGRPAAYTILNTAQQLKRRDVLPLLAELLLA